MITVENLVVEFADGRNGRVRALDRVSFEIRRGERVGLIGPNGCGKTTLARSLNALLLPTSGRVVVDGLDTLDEENRLEIRRRVGMVFQNPDNQIVSATVEREMAFGLENLGVPQQEMRERVESALERFDLLPYRYHPPHLLSGGEKQRLALAAVAVMRPVYVVLDEPTSVLDPQSRRSILHQLSEFYSNSNQLEAKGVLFITQYPEEVEAMDRLLVMHAGRLIYDGPPKGIFEQVDRLIEIDLEPPVEYLADRVWSRYPLH